MTFFKLDTFFEYALKIMVSIIENQVNLFLTLLVAACHNLNQIDNVWMIKLFQKFDFAHRCDRKAFFVVIHLDLFQGITSFLNIVSDRGLVHFSKGALSYHCLILKYLCCSKLQIRELYSSLSIWKVGPLQST